MSKKAIFPGSFDPFTVGHYDIVKRGLELFDEIIIGIGRNSTKRETFPIREREEAIRKIFADEPRVRVGIYDCLTVDLSDYAGYESVMIRFEAVKLVGNNLFIDDIYFKSIDKK